MVEAAGSAEAAVPRSAETAGALPAAAARSGSAELLVAAGSAAQATLGPAWAGHKREEPPPAGRAAAAVPETAEVPVLVVAPA
jgi:hypothetical protein